jgi:adenylate cyclase
MTGVDRRGFWARLARRGTDGLGAEELRKTRLLNQCAALACATNVLFACGYLPDPRRFLLPLGVTVASALLHLSVLALVARGQRAAALFLFLFNCNAQIAVVAAALGPQVGFHYYFFAFAMVVFLVTPRRYAFLYPFAGVSVVGYLYFARWLKPTDALVPIDPGFADVVSTFTIVTVSGTLVLVAFLFDADTRLAEAHLEEEHARSERLLLNILPPAISTRLKDGEATIADGFREVSVLFADIVGFTELSARMPPAELVGVLNSVFSRFDELAGDLGLEKIKTIGDAYMVAAGLPEPRDDHAVVLVRMGLQMRDALARLNEEQGLSLDVRIGVHSGPVVAGVIGKRKFSYDLWGDTVNTASRMESHGEKGRVHVSRATASLLGERFEMVSRGVIPVKGKGELETFFVDGERAVKDAA